MRVEWSGVEVRVRVDLIYTLYVENGMGLEV